MYFEIDNAYFNIFILVMVYELLPYFKKFTKNINQH